jgi:hypothetical protein
MNKNILNVQCHNFHMYPPILTAFNINSNFRSLSFITAIIASKSILCCHILLEIDRMENNSDNGLLEHIYAMTE